MQRIELLKRFLREMKHIFTFFGFMVFIVDPAIVNLINVMVSVVILGTNLIHPITLISTSNTTTTVKRVVSLR